MLTNPRLALIIIVLFVLSGCQSEQQQFIFIGHCYDWQSEQGNRVDPRIAQLDLDSYEQIWLGGDVCSRSSQEAATLEYIDNLFGISSDQTHWAIGNHDINHGSRAAISAATGRPTYYTSNHEAIALLVLDTNFGHPQIKSPLDSLNYCQQLNQQYELIEQLTDTLAFAKYLIILHHHGLLTDELADQQVKARDIFHYVLPALPFACTPAGNFETLVYPRLKAVQDRGIQVILLGGDFGQRAKHFQFKNKDGIWFLGSGINNSMDPRYKPDYVTNLNPDSILLFDYTIKSRELNWKFVPLGDDPYTK